MATTPDLKAPSACDTAFAAVVLYLLGFVVANAHYASFAIQRFELLRARYIAAGLLFFVMTSLPIAYGAFFLPTARRYFKAGSDTRRNHYASTILLWFVAATAAWWLVFVAVGVDVARTPALILYPSAAVVVGGSYKYFERIWTSRVNPEESLRVNRAFYGLHVAIPMLLLAAGFGSWVYPHVRPAFGGGAAWIAEIVVAPDASGSSNGPSTLTGMLIDPGVDQASVLPCTDGRLEHAAVEMPSSRILRVKLRALVPATLRYSDQLCLQP